MATRVSVEVASIAAKHMKHDAKAVRTIAASTLANRRWGRTA